MQDSMLDELYLAMEFPEVTQDANGAISHILFPDQSEMIPVRVDIDGTGLAEIRYDNYSLYQGEIKNASPYNFGIYESGGTTVMGMFDEQMLAGHGIIRYANGSIIRGVFRNNQVDHYGTGYEAGSYIYYAGEFRLNKPDGVGTLIINDYQLIFQYDFRHQLYFGYFQDGLPQGRGVAFAAENKKVARFNRYEGFFTAGLREGSGTLFLANGDMLIGQFYRNVKNGLFVYISQYGTLEFRFYENDISRRSYTSQRYYIPRPYSLRCLCFEVFCLETFYKYVDYFKKLEAGEYVQPDDRISIIDVLFKYCRQLTVPLKTGVCEDMRVCQPFLSEQIAEVARNVVQTDKLDKMLLEQIEDIKSCIINNYDLIRFLFDVYRARDKILIQQRKNLDYGNKMEEMVKQFEDLCIETTKNAQEQIHYYLIAQQNELDGLKTAENDSSESDSNENKQQLEYKESYQLEHQSSYKSINGPEVNLEGAYPSDKPYNDQTDASSATAPAGAMRFAEAANQFLNETMHLPAGHDERNNELLYAFLTALDTYYQLSKQSAAMMFRDMANKLELQTTFYQNEEYFNAMVDYFATVSDSFSLINQFGINQPLCASEYVYTMDNFICLIINIPDVFNVTLPCYFIGNQLVSFAKGIMEYLTRTLEGSREQLDQFINTTEIKNIFINSIDRKHVSETSPTRQSNAGMHSLARSNLSKNTRNTGLASIKSGYITVPRILVRDFSYYLNEIQYAMMRTFGLEWKVYNMYVTEPQSQRNILFYKIINEELEKIVTDHYGVVSTQYIDFSSCRISVLSFLYKVFNSLHEIFAVPKFDEQPQFYANALIPFYMRFTSFDVYACLMELYNRETLFKKETQDEYDSPTNSYRSKTLQRSGVLDCNVPLKKFYEVTASMSMGFQYLIAIMSCVMLRSDAIIYQTEKPKDTLVDDNGSQIESEDMAASVRSDNSLYSKNYQYFTDQYNAKEQLRREEYVSSCFELKKQISTDLVRDTAGEFLEGVYRLLYGEHE